MKDTMKNFLKTFMENKETSKKKKEKRTMAKERMGEIYNVVKGVDNKTPLKQQQIKLLQLQSLTPSHHFMKEKLMYLMN